MVEAKVDTQQKAKKEYPYIGIATKSTKQVVLFTGPNQGVLLEKGIGTGSIGYVSVAWSEEIFDYLVGTITLSNKQ